MGKFAICRAQFFPTENSSQLLATTIKHLGLIRRKKELHRPFQALRFLHNVPLQPEQLTSSSGIQYFGEIFLTVPPSATEVSFFSEVVFLENFGKNIHFLN